MAALLTSRPHKQDFKLREKNVWSQGVTMKVLVAGGSGLVGSHLVRELQVRGADVSVLTRRPEEIERRLTGVSALGGEFMMPLKLRKVMRGFDAFFLLLPNIASEAHEGLTAVALAKDAQVGRIVYLSVQQGVAVPRGVPHVGSKLLIESVIERCGIPYTFIRPSVFMQNDTWYEADIIKRGIYPQPLGNVGICSCDVRDIAEAAAIVISSGRYEAQSITIAGPDTLTGESAAATWSTALQKTIRYGGNDMETWTAEQLEAGMPEWWAFDLKLMYEAWQSGGLIASPAEIDRLAQLLGRPPRSYKAYVDETCEIWLQQGKF